MDLHPCSDVYLCNSCGYPTTKEMPVCQTCLWDMPPEPTAPRGLLVCIWLAVGVASLFAWIGVYMIWKLRFLGTLP